MFIDTHCHIYLDNFDEDRAEMIDRAVRAGIKKLYMPAIDSETTTALLDTELQYPGTCFAMMGLHPCSVKENFKLELKHVISWYSKRNFAAVGEIGLDFYWDRNFEKEQYEAFITQIELSIEKSLPIVIHTRKAMDEALNVLKPYRGKVRGIFHCFGGSLEQAEKAISMGFLLGIGGVLTYKKSTVPEILQKIGLEHLVLETDAPYLPPVPFRGKRNECAYISIIAKFLAETLNLPIETIETVTTRNANSLFSV